MMNMKKSTLFTIIILVNALFFIFGMLVATWFYNTNKNDTNNQEIIDNSLANNSSISDSGISLSNDEISELQDLYFPMFLDFNDSIEKNSLPIMNIITSNFNIEKKDNSNYEKYKNEEGAIIYSKEDLDSVTNELFGDRGQDIITNSVDDTLEDAYVIFANDSTSSEYLVTITDYKEIENENIEFTINYCKYYNNELSEFIDEKINNTNNNDVDLVVTTEKAESSNEELVNKATEEFIKEQKTESATITIKVNNDSKFAKYQLVSIK